MQALILIIVSTILMTFAAVAAPLPTVENFTYAGSGCPDGSAAGELEANGNFSILFDALEAYTSDDEPHVSADCEFSVDVQPAPGWRMSIRRVLLDGIFAISAHGRGWVKTSYGMSWNGDGWDPFWARREFLPGFSGDFNIDDGMSEYPWSGCGAPVRVAGTVEVGARRGAGPSEYSEVIVQNGVVDGQQRVLWHWAYEQCDGGAGPQHPDQPGGFNGAWTSRYETESGQVVAAQLAIDGDHGTYDIGSAVGRLAGLRRTGDVVRGRWQLGQYNGWLELRLATDGATFSGVWGRGTSDRISGNWSGERP